MAAPIVDNIFIREYEKNNGDILTINQLEVGDVGCVVWDAALVLSKYLETKDFSFGEELKGKQMIEIGAGTGIVGLVAASYGAHVRITDLSEFVSLMQMNIDTNKKLITGSAIAECLVWGQTEVTSTHDYVLLADCIYYDESTKPLVDTIGRLCSKDTQVLCCYEHRTSPQKIELQTKFFELMEEKFNKEKIPLEQQDEHFRNLNYGKASARVEVHGLTWWVTVGQFLMYKNRTHLMKGRQEYLKTKYVSCSPCPRVQHIPVYSGCVGAENLDEIDNAQEPFEPYTVKKVLIPRYSETGHRPNIPEYQGCTLWQGQYAPAHTAPRTPSKQATTATVHKSMPVSPYTSEFKKDSQMSKMVTTVPPCNPFNQINKLDEILANQV